MTEQDNIVTLTTTEGIASLITRLRKEESNCASVYIIDAAIETIERLVKERDEARRECCVWGSTTEMGARSLAKFKRWDCYKETTK